MIGLVQCKIQEKHIILFFIVTVMAIVTVTLNSSFGIEYVNYTSSNYKIQFQYPRSWNVTEKSDRFDVSADLTIRKSPAGGTEFIMIQSLDTRIANEITTAGLAAAINAIVEETKNDFTKEIRIIEEPTFLSIDGKQSATFLHTSKDNYDVEALTWGNQMWMVNLQNSGYFIGFLAPTNVFDSPDNMQIRDHFIKSIKFLE